MWKSWLFQHMQSSFQARHQVPDEAASAELCEAEAVHWARTLRRHIKAATTTTLRLSRAA